MAKFEVVVEEVQPTADEIAQHPEMAGIPLSTLLERTGGKYLWHYAPPTQLRQHWRRTATVIGDANLDEVSRSETIPISLEHLRDKDPATTRVKVRFDISYTSPKESRAAAALDDDLP